eukprot:4222177-Karenia_brevis.AAC.1
MTCCAIASGTTFPSSVVHPTSCGALCKAVTPELVLDMSQRLKAAITNFVCKISPTGKAHGVCRADLLVAVEVYVPDDLLPNKVYFAAFLTALGKYYRWSAMQNVNECRVVDGEIIFPYNGVIVEH